MRRSHVALVAVLLTAGCSSAPNSAPKAPAAGASAMVIPAASFRLENAPIPVDLEVTGDGKAEITYGSPAVKVKAATPWKKTVDSQSSDVMLTIMLIARTSSTKADATITCRVSVGGVTMREKTAHGPGAVADCSPLLAGVG
ncbi:MmpS family transport accessory protein [Paractinoplanes durhamensis]|uniref:MmpS family transport accessory protein n=1 Tax=Paractinoplanes durhamensis TaxID=113563 RepID=UPI0019432E94|nr:MmpS family transport accessory protein [Actinoplanes durhamensis]